MLPLHMPAVWVTQGYGVPSVCARHGRPEAQRRRIAITTAAPGWTWALIIVGLVAVFIARFATQKTIAVPAWPFCDRCLKRRMTIQVAAAGTLILAALMLVGGLIMLSDGDATQQRIGPGLILPGMIALIAGLLALLLSAWNRLARAKANEQGTWVRVGGPHPAFEAQFAPYRAMGQQVAAQQATQIPTVVQQPVKHGARPGWAIALVIGILCAFAGIGALVEGVTCGKDRMRPGDTCEDLRTGRITSYEDESATHILMLFAGGAGVLVAAGSTAQLVISSRRAKKAWAAQQPAGQA